MKRLGKRFAVWILTACALLIAPGSALADTTDRESLRVGVREIAPFVMQGEGGEWSGISIELWERVAIRLQFPFEYQEFDLEGLIEAVADGSIDVAVAPLTITADREERIDFTHSYFSTGLGIAVSSAVGSSWSAILGRAFSSGLIRAIGALTVVLFLVGVAIWIVERRRNPDQFGGGPIRGIGSGFWWSAVTMTTVGYGDKAPRSFLGRLIAIVWMFTAIVMISGFTAAITSSLTVGWLSSSVAGPDDLHRVRTGALTGSTSAIYLREQGVRFRDFESVEAGFDAIVAGNLDALVHDAPVLRYLSQAGPWTSVEVVPVTFAGQNYGFGLAEGGLLRESVNRTLLETLSEESWQRAIAAYLGE